jgi:hypothetical protein
MEPKVRVFFLVNGEARVHQLAWPPAGLLEEAGAAAQ